MQSLFPSGGGGAGAGFGGFGGAAGGSAATAPIIELRAGKCVIATSALSNGKHMVTPDSRAGKILLQKESDGLVHFKWANAINNQVEDDRMVFSGEYTFKKVKTGREGDRVYMLKYLSGDMRLMFWLQDKGTDKDAEMIAKINECLLNPIAAADAAAAAASTAAAGGAAGAGPGGMSQEDFMRMMGISPQAAGLMQPPPSSSSSAAAAPTTAAPFGNLDLSSLLNSIAAQPPTASTSTAPPLPPDETSTTAAAPAAAPTDGDGDNSNSGENSGSGDSSGEGGDGPAPMDDE